MYLSVRVIFDDINLVACAGVAEHGQRRRPALVKKIVWTKKSNVVQLTRKTLNHFTTYSWLVSIYQVTNLSEDKENIDNEPVEVLCESCNDVGYGDDMVDCPKFEEDMDEKGINPGWIHKSCCTDEFFNDPQSCLDCCQDEEMLSTNIQEHLDECFDMDGLIKGTSKNNVPVFTNKDQTFYISAQADKLLEPFKPLNVVTDTFTDEESGLFYVKDNRKNIVVYSNDLINEVKEQLEKFDMWGFEQFCIPNGPYFIVYTIGDLSIGGMVAPRVSEEGIDVNKLGIEMATKFRDKYADAEEFFGVKIRPNREVLKLKIQALSEDELINIVLVPILCAQGFTGVKPVSFHGPGESGGDFHPFYKSDEFGKIVYYSAQAKAKKIHAKASKQKGNVNELINQINELFRVSFKSFIDNTARKITRAFIFSSQDIGPDARSQLFAAFENKQTVSLIEIDDIITVAIEKDLSDEILSYQPRKEESEDQTEVSD